MEHLFPIQHSYLIPLLPLAGAAIAGLFGAKILRQQSHWPIWLGVGASAVLSVMLLWAMLNLSKHDEPFAERQTEASVVPAESVNHDGGLSVTKKWFTWIRAGDFQADAAFFFDPLTAVMLCVVTGIGFFITVFAKGYMAGEAGYFRFFAYLGVFIFMMTILVMGDNLVMLYLGWEGVGLSSYLLIGYYYEKPSAREAAKKAFLVNRVGDFGFGLGIMLCFYAFGTISYFGNPAQAGDGLLEMAMHPAGGQAWAMQWIPFLLMLGALGKSAQFPLHVWLPDAMEGPTPVSALIHAATMVTAGVYMIVRCSTLFVGNQAAMATIAVIGAFTAIFAATIALRQFDLKKVFAYSTISQLGFMFVGVAVLAPVTAVFHLVTHAFFKALLFLSSGVVMHAMAGVLDMREMSGLKRTLPWTNRFMLIGCFALAGFPFFSGFFSKDEIIAAAIHRHLLLGVILLVTAFLTAYYTFRLYFRVFQGPQIVPTPQPHGGHGAPATSHVARTPAEDGDDVVAAKQLVAYEFSRTPISDQAGEHTQASTLALQSGISQQSGVDQHLADPAHHAQTGHGHGHAHNHEPLSMMLPLFVLAIGAIVVGYINWTQPRLGEFLGRSPSFSNGYVLASRATHAVEPAVFGQHGGEHADHRMIMIASAAIAIAGIYIAYLFHLRDRGRAERLAAGLQPITRMLEAKYWVDEIYQNTIVEPLRAMGRAFFSFDRFVIDGLVWLIGFVPQLSGAALKLTVQRGYLQGYAAAMVLGIVTILLLIFL